MKVIYNLNYVLNDTCSPCQLNSVDKTIGFINRQYTSTAVDLSNINVSSGNITNIGIISDHDFPLYKLIADDIYNGIWSRTLFYQNSRTWCTNLLALPIEFELLY